MNIFFVGQTGVLGESAQEKRVYNLAHALGSHGRTVVVSSATHKQLHNLNGFTLDYTASLIPESPGGWLYTAASMRKALKGKADVIHISSWKAAVLGIVAALASPSTTLVWTVDELPRTHIKARRITVWLATRLFDAILTPTRNLQQQFRFTFGILPVYLPDGYNEPAIANIPASHWKLRKNQYLLAITDSAESARTLLVSYKNAGSRKKIIVVTRVITPALRRLAKRYPLLHLIESTTPRQRTSLIRQAKAVLLPDTAATQEELLIAMDTGRRVLATTHPLYQETAGTTVEFFNTKDAKHLTELLGVAAKEAGAINKKAQKRARSHFTWARIFDEYETFYHYPVIRRVPIDSVGTNRAIASVPQA